MYDYFTDYITVNIYLLSKGYNCFQNIKNYIYVNDDLYKMLKELCECINPNKTYCGVLKYIKTINIGEYLSKLTCLKYNVLNLLRKNF